MVNEGMQRQWNSPEFLNMWRGLEPTVSGLTAPLMAALQPKPGERVLDVGCGGGLPTLEVAAAVGPTGSATGADISEDLLELARSRAAESGLRNATFVNADVQVDRVPGAPFDAVFSRLGVMFFSDFVESFSNIGRHMKPGGRLVFVCFQSATANPWFGANILAKYAPPRPPSRFPPPTPLALGEEALTREFLAEAGFRGVSFEAFDDPMDAPFTGEPMSGGMLAPMGLAPDVRAKAMQELLANDQRFVEADRVKTIRKMWIVRANARG
ncbi:methyltransferase domain-containing protein [Candidatus Amarobacter glycogenicus]|uniref:class I SAM-dependent methyltransferase n=1 Tax=Candidatus Amarobacter glycogenicus TaxID=3140699 RepID=UPI002A0C7AB3|nr:methyltransferase domain-containing protein [Dehalococcoidia bacterium]